MNKRDLVDLVASKNCGLPQHEKKQEAYAKEYVEIFINSLKTALMNGDRVELRGLGTIRLKNYKGYRGRNPKTGEPIRVRPKAIPFFRPGKPLLDRMNE